MRPGRGWVSLQATLHGRTVNRVSPGRVHTASAMRAHAWAVGIRITELELKPEPTAPCTRQLPGACFCSEPHSGGGLGGGLQVGHRGSRCAAVMEATLLWHGQQTKYTADCGSAAATDVKATSTPTSQSAGDTGSDAGDHRRTAQGYSGRNRRLFPEHPITRCTMWL